MSNQHTTTVMRMLEKSFSPFSVLTELLQYAEEEKRNVSTAQEREYWQGRTDALRIATLLLADTDTRKFLAASGVVTSRSVHMPPVDVDIAHRVSGTHEPRKLTDEELKTHFAKIADGKLPGWTHIYVDPDWSVVAHKTILQESNGLPKTSLVPIGSVEPDSVDRRTWRVTHPDVPRRKSKGTGG